MTLFSLLLYLWLMVSLLRVACSGTPCIAASTTAIHSCMLCWEAGRVGRGWGGGGGGVEGDRVKEGRGGEGRGGEGGRERASVCL